MSSPHCLQGTCGWSPASSPSEAAGEALGDGSGEALGDGSGDALGDGSGDGSGVGSLGLTFSAGDDLRGLVAGREHARAVR